MSGSEKRKFCGINLNSAENQRRVCFQMELVIHILNCKRVRRIERNKGITISHSFTMHDKKNKNTHTHTTKSENHKITNYRRETKQSLSFSPGRKN